MELSRYNLRGSIQEQILDQFRFERIKIFIFFLKITDG